MEMDHIAKSPRLHVPENGKSTRYSLERICAHEVLQDCEPNSPIGSNNKLKRKVVHSSFVLVQLFAYYILLVYAKSINIIRQCICWTCTFSLHSPDVEHRFR